jgi:branched-subunit amino acid ABC-type transport system permease component
MNGGLAEGGVGGALFGAGGAAVVLLCTQVLFHGRAGQGTPFAVVFDASIQGLLNALLAAGLVLIYRAHRIINFAQAALGTIGALFAFNFLAVLGWPFPVAFLIGVLVAAALWNLYRAVSGKYKESLKTGQLSAGELRWTTRIAFLGLTSRAVIFALIAWFFSDAAADYNARKAEGLDGALRKLAHEEHGSWLLALVAAGLFAWGIFCLIQARYREV